MHFGRSRRGLDDHASAAFVSQPLRRPSEVAAACQHSSRRGGACVPVAIGRMRQIPRFQCARSLRCLTSNS